MYNWITPKTNWVSGDYVNIDDFNRIRGNILYLKEQALKFYSDFTLEDVKEMGYSDYVYQNGKIVWNILEDNLHQIVNNTYYQNVGSKKTFYVGGQYIMFNELNRIENACLTYYTLFLGQENAINTLSFELGNYGGIKL